MRHIYDLSAIRQAGRINTDVVALAKTIISKDVKQFKNQHPEYAAQPHAEIMLSLELLKSKPVWKKRYQEFIEAMVFDNAAILKYEDAIHDVERISFDITDSLQND